MNTFSSAVTVPAANGTVVGFKATCSCGTVVRSSMPTMFAAEQAAHIAWHQKRGK